MCELCKRSCFSTSCFVSVLQNSDKKVWTGGQVMKIQKKIVSASCIFLFESVDMWTKGAFLFHVFFLLCSRNSDKKVWTGGQVMKIQKKIVSASCIFLFESVDMWTKGAFLFHVFFLLCSLHNVDTKSVDSGQVMKILSISLFLSTLYPSKF